MDKPVHIINTGYRWNPVTSANTLPKFSRPPLKGYETQ